MTHALGTAVLESALLRASSLRGKNICIIPDISDNTHTLFNSAHPSQVLYCLQYYLMWDTVVVKIIAEHVARGGIVHIHQFRMHIKVGGVLLMMRSWSIQKGHTQDIPTITKHVHPKKRTLYTAQIEELVYFIKGVMGCLCHYLCVTS